MCNKLHTPEELEAAIILPKQNHVTHYHEKIKHQGRQFTEGAIREEGLWIVAGKRLILAL